MGSKYFIVKTMGFELDGQKFIVTGAAKGIGLAISRRLSELGAYVSGWDLDSSSMSRNSIFSHCVRVDVSNDESVASATEEKIKNFGILHGNIENSGVNLSLIHI